MRRRQLSPPRRGTALLESLVAIMILGLAMSGLVPLAARAMRTVTMAGDADSDMERVSGLMNAVAAWRTNDLDRHLGSTKQGRWSLQVEATSPGLYSIRITTSAGRELLRTVLHRPADHETIATR